MEDSKNIILSRNNSYIDHVSHIQNIPNKEQTQYLNFSHSIAYSFSKEKKCKYIYSFI